MKEGISFSVYTKTIIYFSTSESVSYRKENVVKSSLIPSNGGVYDTDEENEAKNIILTRKG